MTDRTPRAPDNAGSLRGDGAPSVEPRDVPSHARGGTGTEAPTPSAGGELPGLATPTLAALYASQGHCEMAAAIYAQLGQGRRGRSPGTDPGSVGSAPQESRAIIEKLLSLRRAASRRRGEIRGVDLHPRAEDNAGGR